MADELKELRSKFKELKCLYENPSMQTSFLDNFFMKLKDQIDLPFFIKSEIEPVQDKAKVNENWQQMSNKIKSFEKDCLKNEKQKNEELSKINEKKLNLNELNNLLLEYKIKIEKKLFNNKTIIFLDKTLNKSQELFHKMEQETSVGKLIIITNDYLGLDASSIINKEFENLDTQKTIHKYKMLISCDKEHSAHENKQRLSQKKTDILKIQTEINLTNELIKCKELQKQLYNNITSNQIIETKLDLSNLTHLDLADNSLLKIDSNLFKDLINLETIWLSNNKIESISSGAFNDLVNLKHLSLASNFLKTIDADLFRHNVSLTHLILANNQLQEIDSKAFYSLKKLIRISFYKNSLTSIDSFLFKGLHCLKEINISENKLTTLDGNIFKDLNKLIKVNLSHNALNYLDLKLFDGLSNLENIYLSNNSLVTLNNELFNGLNKINYVSLQSNKLDSIDKSVFQNITIHW